MEIGDWRAEARGCVKIIWPEIFDKSSPVNKAKVYHTGSKHYIYEINIYLHMIVLTHK